MGRTIRHEHDEISGTGGHTLVEISGGGTGAKSVRNRGGRCREAADRLEINIRGQVDCADLGWRPTRGSPYIKLNAFWVRRSQRGGGTGGCGCSKRDQVALAFGDGTLTGHAQLHERGIKCPVHSGVAESALGIQNREGADDHQDGYHEHHLDDAEALRRGSPPKQPGVALFLLSVSHTHP